jgi:transposase
MKLYGGIDLHSNNSVLAVIDEKGAVVYRKRLRNEWPQIEKVLGAYRGELEGVVVESTFNWYWLVDALQEADYRVHLAHPTAIKPYSGLKHVDDESDARWLAELLRLGILPEGYIYPKQRRGIRDLARKRSQLVEQRTAQLLSIQNTIRRSTAHRASANRIKHWDMEELVEDLAMDDDVRRAVAASLRIGQCLDAEIRSLEELIVKRIELEPNFRLLKTIPGVGNILALTIMLEVGEVSRFESAGDFASYCRCVDGKKLSNGKSKGKANTKNGNKYLGWAFVEAANFAMRYAPMIRRYYERKQASSHRMVALKAVSHKLARASYHIMTKQEPFAMNKAFGM